MERVNGEVSTVLGSGKAFDTMGSMRSGTSRIVIRIGYFILVLSF